MDDTSDLYRPLAAIERVGPSRTPPCPRCNFESEVIPGQPNQPNPRRGREPGGGSIALICSRCLYRFRVHLADYHQALARAGHRQTPAVRDAYFIDLPEPQGVGYRIVRKLFS